MQVDINSTAQVPAKWNAQRVGAPGRPVKDVPTAIAKRQITKRACHCAQNKTSGDYVDPGTLNGMGNAELARWAAYSNQMGMGSWLSDAFHDITGTHLSDIVSPLASVVGTAIGGPVGGAVGSLIGGAVSAGSAQPKPATTGPAAAPAAVGYGQQNITAAPAATTTPGASVSDVISLVTALNKPTAPAAPSALVQAPTGPGLTLNTNTALMIGAGVLAIALLARK